MLYRNTYYEYGKIGKFYWRSAPTKYWFCPWSKTDMNQANKDFWVATILQRWQVIMWWAKSASLVGMGLNKWSAKNKGGELPPPPSGVPDTVYIGTLCKNGLTKKCCNWSKWKSIWYQYFLWIGVKCYLSKIAIE